MTQTEVKFSYADQSIYHILDLTLKFQHKDVLNWKDNVGVYHWFSAWRLLLALLDTPPDEGSAGGAEQWHHAATRGGAGAPPQHLLILQPEGQGLPGGDRAQTQVMKPASSFKCLTMEKCCKPILFIFKSSCWSLFPL